MLISNESSESVNYFLIAVQYNEVVLRNTVKSTSGACGLPVLALAHRRPHSARLRCALSSHRVSYVELKAIVGRRRPVPHVTFLSHSLVNVLADKVIMDKKILFHYSI